MIPAYIRRPTSNESLIEKIDLLTKAIELQNKNLEAEREVRKQLTEELQKMADKITDLEVRHKNLQYTAVGCCGIAIACVGYIAIPIGISIVSASEIGGGIINMIGSAFSSPEKNSSVDIILDATNLSKSVKG